MKVIENKEKRTFAIIYQGKKYQSRELSRKEYRHAQNNIVSDWLELLNTDFFVYSVTIPENDGIIKPLQLEKEFLNKIRLKYGYINLKYDFFNEILTKYFKLTYKNQDYSVSRHTSYQLE